MVTPGAPLIALRRTAVDAGSVAAVLVTVLVVSALVSGVAAALPALQQQALRAALQQLPADDLVVEVVASYDLEDAAAQDAAVRTALAPLTAAADGVVVRKAETVSHRQQTGGRSWSFTAVAGGDGVLRAVDGRLPTDVVGPTVEVAVAGADPEAPAVGSRLTLTSPLDDSRVTAEVVGSWAAAGSEARRVLGGGPAATLLVADGAFEGLAGRASSVRWLAVPAVDRLEPEQLDGLRETAVGIDHEVAAAAESLGGSLRVENPLVETLQERARELAAQRMLLLVPAVVLLLLGAAGAMLVASALAENRRADETLLRSRGAGRRQVVGPTLLEAGLACAVGAAVGPLLAVAVVRIGTLQPVLGTRTWLAGALAALVCWVALVVPVVARSFGADRGEQLSVERRRRRLLTALVAGVLVMLALGAVAVVRLETFSATVTGDTGRVDPLLVASPALLMLALVAVLALVLLPVLFRLAEGALRTRGVALAVGTRAASRAPAKAVPLAVAVALAAGAIMFATAEHASQQGAREARASYEVGTDVRVLVPPPTVRAGADTEREALTGLPGVDDVSGVHRELDFVDDVAVELLVADVTGDAGRTLVASSDDPGRVLDRLSVPSGDLGTDVPAAVTGDLAAQAGLVEGARFELPVAGQPVTLQVVDILRALPTVADGRAGVLVDSTALQDREQTAVPGEWWLAVKSSRVDPVVAAIRERPDLAARLLTRDAAMRRLAVDPGTGGAALTDVMALTAVGSLLIGGVFLSAVMVLRRREREEQGSFLRALGAADRDVTATLATEYAVTAGGGLLAGAGAGLVTAAVAIRATALGSGGEPLIPAPELVVPWAWVLSLLAALLVVPMVALLLVDRLFRGRAAVSRDRWRR